MVINSKEFLIICCGFATDESHGATAVFNQFLEDTLLRNPPTSKGTRRFKVFYGTMKHNPPPKFLLFVNSKKLCPANYLQFLEIPDPGCFLPGVRIADWLDLRERERFEDANAVRKAAAAHNVSGAKWISASSVASNAVELRKVEFFYHENTKNTNFLVVASRIAFVNSGGICTLHQKRSLWSAKSKAPQLKE